MDFLAVFPDKSPITDGILNLNQKNVARIKHIPEITKEISELIDNISAIT